MQCILSNLEYHSRLNDENFKNAKILSFNQRSKFDKMASSKKKSYNKF